ncbi:MAG: indole-3-glycerol-phosphate synthase [Candidatus Bipolaricaulota bacterium]|nr:indole-3-glycerol-phosphate synthase [Candidatus Bipolaricaulota bacterium]
MRDVLDELSGSALNRVNLGFYDIDPGEVKERNTVSFRRCIKAQTSAPVIGEIKPGSPSQGKIFGDEFDPVKLGRNYANGGVTGFSVLTDPDHFYGSLDNLKKVAKLDGPVLMKDFIVDYSQVDAGKALGADAVLFIYRLFTRGIPGFSLEDGIKYAHQQGLEVLLEINDEAEYESALKTDTDMIGINNRDLRSLEVDLSTTRSILSSAGKDRIVWAMSGISDRSDINYLREAGADVFLVGTSLVKAEDPKKNLQKLRGVFDG